MHHAPNPPRVIRSSTSRERELMFLTKLRHTLALGSPWQESGATRWGKCDNFLAWHQLHTKFFFSLYRSRMNNALMLVKRTYHLNSPDSSDVVQPCTCYGQSLPKSAK